MSRKAKVDSNGDGILGDAAHREAQATQFIRYCRSWERTTRDANQLRSLSLYPPSTSRNGQWLVIGKAWSGGYKLVAFHRATDPFTALLGFFQRWAVGKLDWKEDTYAEKGQK